MNKAKLPKKLKVGCMTYTVEFPHMFEYDSTMLGLHEGPWALLRVADATTDLPRSSQRIVGTFVHEVLHTIDFVYLGGRLCEKTIEVLTTAWIQILRDNELYFREGEIPKEVRVGGFVYTVKYPYIFDDSPDFISSAVNHLSLEIYLGHRCDDRDFDATFVKFNMISMILSAIINVYEIDNFIEGNGNGDSIKSFAGGLYQVFRDNKIDEVVRYNLGIPLEKGDKK